MPPLAPLLAALLSIVLAVAAGGVVLLLIRLERRREGELRTLAALAQAVAGAPDDANEVAEAAYIHTARLLPSDFFQLGVFEGEAYRTLIWIRDGDRVHNREFTLANGREGLVGWIRRTGQSLLVTDFRDTSSLPVSPSYASDDPPASGLFVPLMAENAVIGVIAVQSRRAKAFRRREELLLRALAGSVATTLAAMTWRAEVRSREQQIGLLEDVARLLTPLKPLSDVLPVVARQIAGRLEASVAIFEAADSGLVVAATSAARSEARFAERPELRSFVQASADDMKLMTRTREAVPAGPGPHHPVWECACPLRVQDRVLGVLYLRRRSSPFLRADRGLVELVASQLALAMLEAANYAMQQEEAWFTTVLLEISRHASQPGDSQVALLAVVQLTTLLAGAGWAILLETDPSGSSLTLGPTAGLRRQILDRLSDESFTPDEFGATPPFLDETPRSMTLPPLLAEATGSGAAVGSVLTDGKALLGLLLVQAENVEGRRSRLLTGIAHQISLRLENTALIEAVAVRRSLERELQTARTIQQSFLPMDLPQHPAWQVGAFWRAARSVGGDFYDFIPLAPGPDGARWGLAIADVSDKGVPAALFMALTRTLLRTVAPSDPRPSTTLSRLNHLLLNETSSDMFVSAWYGVWEPDVARLTYANAGHLPPFLFHRDQGAVLLPAGQTVLGVLPEIEYREGSLELPEGSLLLMFTDGISEASDGPDLFGLQRIENTVLGLADWSPDQVVAALSDRVAEFSGQPDPADDLTIVCLYRQPDPTSRKGAFP
ncbi:MAG TPA: SpoIIE family protein phosphatase [Anaerolineales bacterium]|nr:SpoIIE family protein phosphatase [Anaerolineales bacterium]